MPGTAVLAGVKSTDSVFASRRGEEEEEGGDIEGGEREVGKEGGEGERISIIKAGWEYGPAAEASDLPTGWDCGGLCTAWKPFPGHVGAPAQWPVCRERVFGNVPDRDPAAGAGGGRDVGAWVNVLPVREEGPGIAGGRLPVALRALSTPCSIPDSTAAFRSLMKSSGPAEAAADRENCRVGQWQGCLLWRTRSCQPMAW